MADAVKQPLLHHHQPYAYPSYAASASSPALPSVPHSGTATPTPGGGGGGAASSFAGGRRFPGGLDVPNLKKRGGGTRSWIRVEAATASVQTLEVDKATMMRRCELPARDLRLLDPLFVYPSTVLGRERAIVVNLEQIRCVITADEVLLLNSLDSYVFQYAAELQRRLLERAEGDELPFEFRALELALEAACSFLDAQAAELEIEAYPLLDELTSKISTLNLERVRRLKSRLVALTRRVQKVRDEIEQLMDDDGDMAEMYLTEKKMRMESSSVFGDQSLATFNAAAAGTSVSAPVSPVSSPTESRKLEKTYSLCRSRHDSVKSSDNTVTEHIEELEMLLEAYFVVIDSTLNKLTSLKEYIDDTEDFINIQLDNVRNQLIQFELLLTTATFVVAIFGVVAGVFGMNFETDVFNIQNAFQWVLIITGVVGAFIFCFFVWFFKYKRLMPL
ncbi:magnesium transporter MRS2-B-like [Triticum dicoccoides]|uniref:magnesium transporter MRS2-B-like n=1 Tax=Triticum dicoccoides TaxID=85692 RepID=UPI000E7AD4DC|nr:magnesium transporter MRS2-B-like [Triticum dicoccoides]